MTVIAFFSYARVDDDATKNLLSKIRVGLESEVRAFSGDHEYKVFQDIDGIKAGDEWESVLRDALDRSAFFLPVLTPTFFRRPYCRKEIDIFLTNYKSAKDRKRIIPIQYLPLVGSIGDGSSTDPLRIELEKLQAVDLKQFRRNSSLRGELDRTISKLAERIANLI